MALPYAANFSSGLSRYTLLTESGELLDLADMPILRDGEAGRPTINARRDKARRNQMRKHVSAMYRFEACWAAFH